MRSAPSFAPSDSFNRSFGLLAMAACVAGAVMAQIRHAVVGWSVAAVIGALCMGALALWAPRTLTPLSKAWMGLGMLMGRVVNPLVFGLMFFALITPVAWVMRLRGRDALKLRPDASARSYWVDRQPPGPRPESFKNQF